MTKSANNHQSSIKLSKSEGQALITLLFFVLIGFTIISASAVMIFNNIQATSINERADYAHTIAESGVDEALIRLIRDPSYTGTAPGQPLSVNGGSVEISVVNGVITTTGTYSNSIRKIRAQTVYNENVLSVISWEEIE